MTYADDFDNPDFLLTSSRLRTSLGGWQSHGISRSGFRIIVENIQGVLWAEIGPHSQRNLTMPEKASTSDNFSHFGRPTHSHALLIIQDEVLLSTVGAFLLSPFSLSRVLISISWSAILTTGTSRLRFLDRRSIQNGCPRPNPRFPPPFQPHDKLLARSSRCRNSRFHDCVDAAPGRSRYGHCGEWDYGCWCCFGLAEHCDGREEWPSSDA